MFDVRPIIADHQKEAVKTYENDITGLVEGKEAKYKFITVDKKKKKQEPVELWKKNVRKQNLESAQSWYKKARIVGTALIVVAVAAVILMAISIAGAPLLGAATAAIGTVAIISGISFAGLLVAQILINHQFRKRAKEFGKQYVVRVQKLLMEKPKVKQAKPGKEAPKPRPDLTLASVPKDRQQIYANAVAKYFKNSEYQTAMKKAIARAAELRFSMPKP